MTVPFLEDLLDQPLRETLAYMQSRIVHGTRYFGVPTLKNPLDFWLYQELIYHTRPDFIVEIGNRFGGSTLALAHICELLGCGEVIGVDINHSQVPARVREHDRITLLQGDATALVDVVADRVGGRSAMVIEDSAHTFENTLSILRHYSPLVSAGNYFIVEDSICHHGLSVGPSPGPFEAIEAFVKEDDSYVVDRNCEAFVITWNPKGFLRKIA